MTIHDNNIDWDIDYTIYYRSWHDDSPEHRTRQIEHHVRQLTPFLPSRHQGNALDIGCGMGFAMSALEALGYSAEGIDIDAGQVALCQKAGLKVTRCSDIEIFLREQVERYSVILLLDVLEHLPIQVQIPVLRAIRRSLIPGGVVVVQVPNANSPLAMRWRYNDVTHTSSFTEHSLRFVLLNAGFKDIAIPAINTPSRPSLRFWKSAARRGFRQGFWRWLIRGLWHQILIAELGDNPEARNASLELNLIYSATRKS